MARTVISTIKMVIFLMGVTAMMSLQVVVINLTSKDFIFFLEGKIKTNLLEIKKYNNLSYLVSYYLL